MGSLEEDELVQMVQDFIESESTSTTTSTSSNCHTLSHRTQYFILQDVLRSEGDAAAEAKVLKCVLKHMRGRKGAENRTSLSRWLAMRMKMDGLNASICHTSWATSLGCPAGEYEYIEVIPEDEDYGKPLRVIVDIDFRSQFEVARPTQHYKELTDSVPDIFVGTENKLCSIISLLCSAAKQCLREKGLHVPPWRTASYMQAKWLSVSRKEANHAGGGRENYVGSNGDVIGDEHTDIISEWVPPLLKPKKRDLGGGSSLSNQLSNMSINYCC
ncbi:hypothetical protein VNO80_11511 [Phaseolus coccineus]|uniref:Uncharacterized protein n=1 Tax=Phaseolus coccineus TaxID=3886 RepID=A0AAN9NFB8_PHACN